MAKTIKHLLVLRFSAMGDVAMAVPVIRAFKAAYPEVLVTVVTRPKFSPFFNQIEGVNVFEADVDAYYKGIFGLLKLAKALKALKPNVVADLHNVLRTKALKILLFWLKFKQINKGREDKKALTSGRLKQALKTTHQRYADVFNALGFELSLTQPKFPTPVKLASITVNLLGLSSGVWIGIAPFAKYPSKMYPLSLMEQVIASLSKNNTILLFGAGKTEEAQLIAFEKKYKNVISIAGKLNLAEQLDVISNLKLMLAMDSANGHLAAMLGIPVVTIWGVTHPNAGFTPFNQPLENQLLPNQIQYPKIPTSIYGNVYPEAYKNAAGSIAPTKVIDAIERIIRK